MLIEQCPTLSHDNDIINRTATAANPQQIFWEKPENVNTFFQQLRTFLDKRLGNRQDLSFAANTKQRPKELASDFFVRFKRAWVEDSKLPMGNEMKALFINTFLNNMHARQAQLIRITTSNLHDMDIDALGKRIRELDASGGFIAKAEVAMFSGPNKPKPQGKFNRSTNARPHSDQKRKSDIVCFHCGKKGHIKRDCRELQGQMRPQQQNATSHAVYQTEWQSTQH